ncbi:hypothetical protein [Pasteuria penetrans]|uniref:hypothetical protein n=1 Tax=Pasteuria penetrans TaxID=86005 RepID=UPI000FBA98A5|nr:hypothetical protein [Pasteuria penetrans]
MWGGLIGDLRVGSQLGACCVGSLMGASTGWGSNLRIVIPSRSLPDRSFHGHRDVVGGGEVTWGVWQVG